LDFYSDYIPQRDLTVLYISLHEDLDKCLSRLLLLLLIYTFSVTSELRPSNSDIYSRKNNDPNTRAFYIKYCKILNNVIKEAKKQHYSRLIAKSDNKIKTAWNIIRRKTGKIHLTENMPSLLTNNEKVKDPGTEANAFNIFF
jgi:hypothetical protein